MDFSFFEHTCWQALEPAKGLVRIKAQQDGLVAGSMLGFTRTTCDSASARTGDHAPCSAFHTAGISQAWAVDSTGQVWRPSSFKSAGLTGI